jgi:hypothetical protein
MEIDKKPAWLNRPKWKKAQAINSWMMLLFKPSANGDLSPALFGVSILP